MEPPLTTASASTASPDKTSGASTTATRKKLALLEKITEFERRGAILYADARTLRNQVHDSTSGQWRAVETRLKQLAMSWNPYQDVSADDRKRQERANMRRTKDDGGNDREKDEAIDGKDAINKASRLTSSTETKQQKTKKKQDFYVLLQIADPVQATHDDIKRQFRKLALRLHPDKQQQIQASSAATDAIIEDTDTQDGQADSKKVHEEDSTEFARLRLAYETLSNPVQRAAYDIKLATMDDPGAVVDDSIHVKNQIQLEASTDFASLEWMARVKHKMDVMDRIAEWAKILGINATQIRFETGEPCNGKRCGKIVTMDRDLECYGSPRRRVYVCLLHKYIHACDELCTSRYGDAELDKKVCPMRAYWLIQNWLFDQLQSANATKEGEGCAHDMVQREEEKETKMSENVELRSPITSPNDASTGNDCTFEASNIHLGDALTAFAIANAQECQHGSCSRHFQFLDDGIYACKNHGSPHICTFEQCDEKVLRDGRYVCWISGYVYGGYREEAGTGTRTRQLVYTDAHGDTAEIEMEVPVLLPLGKTTSYLLEGNGRSAHYDDLSSFSPPPPSEKAWHTPKKFARSRSASCDDGDERSPRPMLKKRRQHSDRETSPVRARIRRRLAEKVQQAEVSSFYVHLKLPAAVANLPRVALELQDPGDDAADDDENGNENNKAVKAPVEKLLPIRVRAIDTVNYIKFWMEELTDQQISIWDQQILWGDTVIGDETNVMVLEQHGITDGCVLELRLHDDCPLLVSTWNGQTAAAGNVHSAAAEYNTVLISKEAEEDLEDLQDEWENVIAVEEDAFARSRLSRKREKLEQAGALHHKELLQYDGSEKAPRLLGVIPMNQHSRHSQQLITHHGTEASNGTATSGPRLSTDDVASRQVEALKSLASGAKPLK
uniref:J domain-containing protein n=1 Tax=Globisporangium ultimum (strain ATCC 200006 / CBS 805.95 / DAOM BR144) TaxID=431595 RepID=K3X841_GLOUD